VAWTETERERLQREEEQRALGREGTAAGLAGENAGVRARVRRLQGESEDARRIEEAAARAKDEVRRKELRRQFIDEGFGEREAGRMAGQQVKADQANRLLDQLGREAGSGVVVASSLARIAGGGGMRRDIDRIAPPTHEEAKAMGIRLPSGDYVKCLRCDKTFWSEDPKKVRLCVVCGERRRSLLRRGGQMLDIPLGGRDTWR
jgi:hypothetical protein